MQNKKKGRILYIGGFELPDKNAAAHRVIGNAKVLREIGFEVTLIGLNTEISELVSPKSFEGFKYFEAKYPKTLVEWYNYLTRIDTILKFIQEDKNITKIIAYNYPAIALNKLRKLNLEVYSDCTEWYEPQGHFFFRMAKSFDVWYRMKFVQKKLNGIIVISDFLQDYYTKKIPCINIPPLIDKNDNKWIASFSQAKNTKGLVFTYSGSPGSGVKDRLDVVINVISQLKKAINKDIELNIIGITEEQFRATFGKMIGNEVVYSFVKFWGRLSHLNALSIIKNSNYFVFFRDNNLTNTAGFPTKFVESVSLGVPVITNSSSNIALYFNKYPRIGLITKNNNEDELLEDIRSFIQMSHSSGLYGFTNIFHYENYKEEFTKIFK